jgi:rod shape determining protein RodA
MIHNPRTLPQKLAQLNWGLICLVTLLAGVGFVALYSAADGRLSPWAIRHSIRFGGGLVMMIVIGLIPLSFWRRVSYVIYGLAFALLLAVEIMGVIGMGAQRWIDLGIINLQPSEMMKIALIMALATYAHNTPPTDLKKISRLVIPAILILLPAALVLRQPDLGTAVMLIAGGGGTLFLAGANIWLFIGGGIAALGSLPIAWQFLHDYQKDRILTFLNPESDPLGAGYHITQSKIALGSGGLSGKGYLQGTQSHLNFLPEKQTDFIFTLLAEEWGFIGVLFLLILFACVFLYGLIIALRARSFYGRFLSLGLMINFSLYVVINIAMVTGLIPVVGVPLPLISYGGSAMLAALISFGIILSVDLHHHEKIPRSW